MSLVILAGATDQYTEVKMWTTADGAPKTDAAYNTSGLSIKYQVGNAAVQSVTVGGSPAPATMSAGGAHADWGIYHVSQGRYKIGLADAVVASAGDRVAVWIELTDCDSQPAEIYVSGYNGALTAVGANTTTPPTVTAVADEVQTRTIARVTLVDAVTTNTDMVAAAPTVAEIEAALINEGDATALLQAIADKISGDLTAGDLTALAIVSAIKADATLAEMISRIDVTLSSRSAIDADNAGIREAAVNSAIAAGHTID